MPPLWRSVACSGLEAIRHHALFCILRVGQPDGDALTATGVVYLDGRVELLGLGRRGERLDVGDEIAAGALNAERVPSVPRGEAHLVHAVGHLLPVGLRLLPAGLGGSRVGGRRAGRGLFLGRIRVAAAACGEGYLGAPGLVERLAAEHGLNALVCSGGISHIPVDAFAVGWDAFPPGSWLVATAREEMDEYAAGLEDVHTERFVHRLAFSGEPIEYIALRGRKPSS